MAERLNGWIVYCVTNNKFQPWDIIFSSEIFNYEIISFGKIVIVQFVGDRSQGTGTLLTYNGRKKMISIAKMISYYLLHNRSPLVFVVLVFDTTQMQMQKLKRLTQLNKF